MSIVTAGTTANFHTDAEPVHFAIVDRLTAAVVASHDGAGEDTVTGMDASFVRDALRVVGNRLTSSARSHVEGELEAFLTAYAENDETETDALTFLVAEAEDTLSVFGFHVEREDGYRIYDTRALSPVDTFYLSRWAEFPDVSDLLRAFTEEMVETSLRVTVDGDVVVSVDTYRGAGAVHVVLNDGVIHAGKRERASDTDSVSPAAGIPWERASA